MSRPIVKLGNKPVLEGVSKRLEELLRETGAKLISVDRIHKSHPHDVIFELSERNSRAKLYTLKTYYGSEAQNVVIETTDPRAVNTYITRINAGHQQK